MTAKDRRAPSTPLPPLLSDVGIPKRMKPTGTFVFVLALALSPAVFIGAHASEGVAKLPAWNAYQCNISEDIVIQNANLMISLGLADAGYNYVNIDDCYAAKQRNSDGDIVANQTKFPSGMKTLTDNIHALGFDAGWFTCQLYPGSYQNEARDAKLFQDEWGFDYLKYDNCAVPFDNITRENIMGRYARMANAISDLSQSTGNPPLILSLCEWGREQVWLWGKRYGQSWRLTLLLFSGNGNLTYEESKTHFTAWALMKSPLLIGTDLETASDQTIEILTNREIIAINQDPVVGTGVTPFRWGINPDYISNNTHPAQYWSGESQNGTVFMLINTLDEPATMFFNLTESPWIRAGIQYSVRDLWAHSNNGTAVRNFTAYDVPPHGVVALLLQDAGDEPEGLWPPCAVTEWCISQSGVRID
ncbi:glycoside hydrolase family 27 protein [Pisolithus tinctorius Marx 270]|uniref:Alpha-galactosidase n=1 Tax=Pisolithus tinctorius Marx 270 TaxID=870435 RepID=A0A0C3JPE9_PISTI|nr:glycoside hydrolase family 27 protein [Pisolithus tinctorius Marx 270]